MLAAAVSAYADIVTGTVLDDTGEAAIGVSISVEGANIHAVTDIDGNYSINVPSASDKLTFTYVGCEPQTINVDGRSKIDVMMKPKSNALNEVVVVGYATQTRKEITGLVASVKSDIITQTPGGDATQALAGRMSGVQIITSDGQPGATPQVRVRGGISITQDNSPLFVIDGFPTEDGMANLNPADIESIDVLKDASATAIYGARGANGVVLVTTKSGAKNDGKAHLTFDAYLGTRRLAKRLKELSVEQFVIADYERTLGWATDAEATMRAWQNRYGGFIDIPENYANRPGIDWLDETMGRTTVTQNYRAAVQGGNDKFNYYASYGYISDDGAMVHSGSTKHSISANIKGELSKRLSITGRINYDTQSIFGAGVAGNGTNTGGSNTNARFNKLVQIFQYRPTTGLRGNDSDLLLGDDEIYTDDSGNVLVNPVINAAEEQDNREVRTLQANAGLTFKLGRGWIFRNTTGTRYQSYRRELFYGPNSIMGRRNGIYGSIINTETGSVSISNVLTYDRRFQKKHHVMFQLGQEYVSRWTRRLEAGVINLPTADFGMNNAGLGTPSAVNTAYAPDDKLLSFFTRLNYDYKARYLFNFSVRADGSSKFGKNNKWGYFPAVSAAWRIGEEDAVRELGVFSDLKLRAGYGLAGNNRIGQYNSLALMESVLTAMGDVLKPGFAAKQIPNPALKWESNKTFNIGLDLGFLSQRITVTPEFYVNNSNNLLLNAPVPMSSGFSYMIINAGSTRNIGLDLTVTSHNLDVTDFDWTTTLTLTHNRNTVTGLVGGDVQYYEAKFGFSQNTHVLEVGKPIGQFYGYITDGLYQVEDFNYSSSTKTYSLKDGVPYSGNRDNVRPGMWKFRDLDGDGEITEADKTVIGNAQPKLYGGLNNSFMWKGFDLSVFVTFSLGADVLNATKLVSTKVGTQNANVLNIANSDNRWMTINSLGEIVTDPAELAALNQGKTVAAYYDLEQGDMYVHSWAVEDASFLKLANLTFGYTLPSGCLKSLGVSKLRLYFTGNNIATLTKYSGFDPEVSTMSSPLTPGVDFGAYPLSRTFIFGANITF
ncbi:MAG: TonB-dependent receptor [Muribaculaceae bacterium]|nr:TonB-dependent receptor [Muribaculaceae bacterium]